MSYPEVPVCQFGGVRRLTGKSKFLGISDIVPKVCIEYVGVESTVMIVRTHTNENLQLPSLSLYCWKAKCNQERGPDHAQSGQ